MLPTVRRTWAPRGETPLLRHRYGRAKVSAISAVTVSPRRHRCGLYAHFHCDNITQGVVALFLRLLLRHLAGPIIVLWDGGAIHAGPEVEHLLARHPHLQVERFPAYAPELNPDELVWNYLKGELANGSPDTITELLDEMSASRADFAARPPCYARVHRRLRAAVPFFGLNLHGPRSIFVAGLREESAMHSAAPVGDRCRCRFR